MPAILTKTNIGERLIPYNLLHLKKKDNINTLVKMNNGFGTVFILIFVFNDYVTKVLILRTSPKLYRKVLAIYGL